MKTVLIYDSKNYISRFLKFRLKHAYKFIKFTNGKFSNYKLSKAYTYENFDLIIVGSHNQNWLEKAVMGSVTESIVAKSKIPIFIIPINLTKF